jgi:hypothetical protein
MGDYMRIKRVILICGLLCIALCEARADVQEQNGKAMHMAFVLLSEARLPQGKAIAKAFTSFAPKGQRLTLRSKSKEGGQLQILEFDLGPKGNVLVALMPIAVPNGEADNAVQFSISAMGTGWRLAPHKAHLMVSLRNINDNMDTLSQFTSVLAAVARSSPAVGIYWGAAGATHDPRFFVSIVRDAEGALPIMLWTGLSIAREEDGRHSVLSLGMKQLNLPDLLLVAPKSASTEVLTTFWDLLNYVAELGKPIPEGDTVGRTENERIPVHYVPSPIDPSIKVWRIELPPTILSDPPSVRRGVKPGV